MNLFEKTLNKNKNDKPILHGNIAKLLKLVNLQSYSEPLPTKKQNLFFAFV